MPIQFITKGSSCDIYLINNIIHKVCKNHNKFKKELSFLEDIQEIPMVVRLIDYDKSKNTIKLEYLPFTLEDLIIKKKLTVQNKIDILQQVSMFIIKSQDIGIVHNDLKAKNILVDYDMSSIKICDFDISKWGPDQSNDIKKFKLLIIQMIFDISYENSYRKFKYYSSKTKHNVFNLDNIYDIHDIIPELFYL